MRALFVTQRSTNSPFLLHRYFTGIGKKLYFLVLPFAAGVFLTRGVMGATGGGIAVGAFLLGVVGSTSEGSVPALGLLAGGCMLSS